MAAPQTYKAYRRSKGATPKTLQLTTEELPSSLDDDEVLIRIHAVSLNYRDVAMLHGKYPVKFLDEGIPVSDCAAEVISVGSRVHDFQIGDHVTAIFDLKNLTGTEDESSGLGGEAEGVLREYAVFNQNLLLHLPKHLSWEEVSYLALQRRSIFTFLRLTPFTLCRQHVLHAPA
jgi:NADPH:quinone reductase-like Zn-dependent oxidoreductase